MKLKLVSLGDIRHFSFSIKNFVVVVALSCVSFFHVGEFFTQATVIGGFHLSLQNEGKPSIKLCSILGPRLVKSWPRPAQDFSGLGQELLKTCQVWASTCTSQLLQATDSSL